MKHKVKYDDSSVEVSFKHFQTVREHFVERSEAKANLMMLVKHFKTLTNKIFTENHRQTNRLVRNAILSSKCHEDQWPIL